MTQFRIYHAHVEREEGYYEVTLYNMFGRQMETKKCLTNSEVRRLLHNLWSIEPKFTSNWGIEKNS